MQLRLLVEGVFDAAPARLLDGGGGFARCARLGLFDLFLAAALGLDCFENGELFGSQNGLKVGAELFAEGLLLLLEVLFEGLDLRLLVFAQTERIN